eukprot:g72820.t1
MLCLDVRYISCFEIAMCRTNCASPFFSLFRDNKKINKEMRNQNKGWSGGTGRGYKNSAIKSKKLNSGAATLAHGELPGQESTTEAFAGLIGGTAERGGPRLYILPLSDER